MEAGGEDEQQPPAKGVVEMQEKNIGKVKVDDDDDLKKEAAENKTVSFGELLRYADGVDWMLMGLGTLGSVVHGMAQPVGYLLLGKALNAFGSNINDDLAMVKALDKVVPFVWYMAIATFPAGILEIGCWMYSSERQLARWRIEYLKAVLRQEVGAFDTDLTTGKIITGVTNHMTIIQDAIGEKLGHFLSSFATFFCGVLIAAVSSWEVSLLTLMVVPMILGIGATYTKKMNAISSSKMVYLSSATSMVEESTSNIRTVASFCYEPHILAKAKSSLKHPMKMVRNQSIKFGLIQGVSLCLWNIAHAVALWYTTRLVERGQSSFKDGIRAYQIFSLTVPSITELWTLIPAVVSAMNVLAPAFETLDRKTEIEPDQPKADEFKLREGRVEFQNIKFNYPLRPEVTVLNNFSLQIEPGLKVALVGPSGAGKSSVLALLLRFYDPLQGNVMIDGKNIKEYNLRMLRRQIGLVQQEPLLFSYSIRDNIKYGNEEASEAEVVQVSREANIHGFVSNLPDGYDTVVGDRGCQLSGGQKQRIAIARTLLKRPAILLLDEATSALDTESERSIVNALESISENNDIGRITQITVAHRLSTIRKSDSIVVMDKGEIVEMGTHSSLLASSGGVYSRLYELQNLA
ncbi:ABC transporter B family member 1 [Linum perenne]